MCLYALNIKVFFLIFIKNYFVYNVVYIGHDVEGGEGGIIWRILNAIMDLLKMGGDGIYQIIVLILGLIWSILKIPLGMLGIVKKDGGGTNIAQNYSTPARAQSSNNDKRNKSKLPSFRKDRFGRGNVMRLSHLETDEDRNRLSNGNSTMYGGDGDK